VGHSQTERKPLLGDEDPSTHRKRLQLPKMGEKDKISGEKQKTKITGDRLFTVICILATELCERLTYYSVVANQVLFCTNVLKIDSSGASMINYVFVGMYNMYVIYQMYTV